MDKIIINIIILLVLAFFFFVVIQYNLKHAVSRSVLETLKIGEKRNTVNNIFLENSPELIPDVSFVIKPLLATWGIGNDPGSLVLISGILKFLGKVGVGKVVNDYYSRPLSDMQFKKMDVVRDSAISQFYMLAKKDGWDQDKEIEEGQYKQAAIDYVENLINKAVNESNINKQRMFGAFLGQTMYYYNSYKLDWNNLLYVTNLLQRLTIRQKVLLHFINDNFLILADHYNNGLCVTNPLVISELKDMLALNFWSPIIGISPDPTHTAIPILYMKPTELTQIICKDVPLTNSIIALFDDIVDSLDLKMYTETDLKESFISLILSKIGKNN